MRIKRNIRYNSHLTTSPATPVPAASVVASTAIDRLPVDMPIDMPVFLEAAPALAVPTLRKSHRQPQLAVDMPVFLEAAPALAVPTLRKCHRQPQLSLSRLL
ncbi:MAG: hypothetical protein MUC60_18420, partial [Oscillatoria sp. Prado101]|nr:hypothetical protein [Oscillatoria sp. Prado101]